MESSAHHALDGASFSFYTSEELQKLSVLQITSIEPFDGLGHALANGLYDERLGPCKKFDICPTCRCTEEQCEGHVGHIVLPMPIINPVLMSTLELVLRFTCLKCLHLRISRFKLEIHALKIEFLDYGLDYIVDEIDEFVEACVAGIEQTDNMIDGTIQRIRKMIKSSLKEKQCQRKYASNIRTIVEKKKLLQKDFWKINTGRKCIRCDGVTKIIALNSRTFFMVSEKVEDVVYAEDVPEEHRTLTTQKVKRIATDKVKRILRSLWKNEAKALRVLFPFLAIPSSGSKSYPTDVFFWDVINVAASKFQPLRVRDDRTYVHERRALLIEILRFAKSLEETIKEIQKKPDDDHENEVEAPENDDAKEDEDQAFIKKANKFYREYDKLQILCNRIYNSEMNKSLETVNPGVVQGLEKKQGLFRNNMMGKRVNFAARTVISPDPYITANELGLPVIFARKLTYPQPVTYFNLKLMQKAILNGPAVHPGANSVIIDGFEVLLRAHDLKQRRALSERLEYAVQKPGHQPVVRRHLVSGDVVLFNRQPTLHKPSIMAHIARVLPAEKTFRMHYSNCKAYNADFDGDEMNVHFPQSELARAEAYDIASVNQQYLTPKDGTPLSGLIQDHIVAAALLSLRGTFFTRDDYHELIYGALSFLNREIITVAPAIISPRKLWTGKQLITTLIMNVVPMGYPRPTVSYACKIKPKAFIKKKTRKYHGHQLKPEEMCESQVVILKGEHLSGIIDKSSIGNQQHGLVHVCYEIYGGQVSTNLLTAFARLSTNYLQCHIALTLGIVDILVDENANKKRKDIILSSKDVGTKAVLSALSIQSEILTEEQIRENIRAAHVSRDSRGMKLLDSGFKAETDQINNQISSVCLDGLVKTFPENNLQLMIQAGAKGGTVNALQISCLLGQIELEGRRVPLMMSGKTLPSFVPYDTTPRAGGFIAGRFLTGIRPQEFFFHCMAGREGLVDTAVKTASSGYLQRCIIKHMEGLMVNYDLTVRDSDGSIIQFLYGEDGLDVTKSQIISSRAMPILIQNRGVIKPSEEEQEKILSDLSNKRVMRHVKKIRKWERYNGSDRTKHERGSGFLQERISLSERMDEGMSDGESNDLKMKLIEEWFKLDRDKRKEINMRWLPCPDPLNSAVGSEIQFGSISDRIEQMINSYVTENPDNLLIETDDANISPLIPDIKKKSTILTSEPVSKNDFFSTYCYRLRKAACEPGEPVGVLVGHSIGEPSTQMTLNTFHFAGRGEMNVTLGIPRLREILMHASDKITTPSMDIPFRQDIEMNDKRAAAVRLRLNAVKVSDVLQEVEIKESLVHETNLKLIYEITFEFLKYKHFKTQFNVTPSQILNYMEKKFITHVRSMMHNKIQNINSTSKSFSWGKKESVKESNPDEGEIEDDDMTFEDEKRMDKEAAETAKHAVEDDEDGSSDEDDGDGGTLSSKRKAKKSDETDFQEPEEDEPEKMEDFTEDLQNELDNEDVKESAETDTVSKKKKSFQVSESEKESRKENVINRDGNSTSKVKVAGTIRDYDFDDEQQKWCRLTISLDLRHKLDVASVIEDAAKSCYIYKVGQIKKAFLVKDTQAGKRDDGYEQIIKTEGVSFLDLVRLIDVLDLNRVYSNDIQAIAKTYGIEAGGQAIRREIKNVFAAYGITVDPRHLSLIADYMTFSGKIEGMNRGALAFNSSPLQQMTFESTSTFMRETCLMGLPDDISSPSACIFAGVPPRLGTGSFSLYQKSVPVVQRKQSFANQSFSTINWSPKKSVTPHKRRSRIVIPLSDKKPRI